MSDFYFNPNPDELYHYGVLGMRWGHRKAQAHGTTYTYQSHSTKKANRRASRAYKNMNEEHSKARELDSAANSYAKAAKSASSTRKANRLNKMAESARSDAKIYRESAKEYKAIGDYQKSKARASAKHDSKMQSYATSMSAGKVIAQRVLLGGSGQKAYASLKASDKTRGKAAVGTLIGLYLGGGAGAKVGAAVAKSNYINGNDKRKN